MPTRPVQHFSRIRYFSYFRFEGIYEEHGDRLDGDPVLNEADETLTLPMKMAGFQWDQAVQITIQ